MIECFIDAKNALMLAPHPDDEALGCSGTIALLNRNGASSRVVFLTDGELLTGELLQDIADKRRAEGRSASRMLGCREPLFLGFPDGAVRSHSDAIFHELSDIIEEQRPDFVFAPSPVDFHNDHTAASETALRLFNELGSFKLAFYEVYSTLRFNELVDITGVVEIKKKAIMNYRTSLYERPEVYVYAMLGLNAQRSIFTQKSGYYEAFLVIEKPVSEKELFEILTYRR